MLYCSFSLKNTLNWKLEHNLFKNVSKWIFPFLPIPATGEARKKMAT